MKNKQFVAVIISFLVIVSLIGVLSSLLGFRLAKKNGATVTEPDQLVGFLITTEDINLLDMDAVMQDNIDAIISGKEIELDNNDLNAYQGRLYATVKKETYTDEETGATYGTYDYVFEGVDGVCFFIARNDGYTQNVFDEEIFDSLLSIGSVDMGKESVSIEGIIYALPAEKSGTIYYFNYVYQSADGKIYAISGGQNIFAVPDGGAWTVEVNEKSSKTGDGADHASEFSASITLKTESPAESITMLQMNGLGEVISREEFIPGSMPETQITNRGADYIIVETNYIEKDGEMRTERSIISKGEVTLSTIYYPEDSMWGIGQSTMLEWNE